MSLAKSRANLILAEEELGDEVFTMDSVRPWLLSDLVEMASMLADVIAGVRKPTSEDTFRMIGGILDGFQSLTEESGGKGTELWHCLDDAADLAGKLRTLDEYPDDEEDG